MAGDEGLPRLAVLSDEGAAQSLGVFDRFFYRPAFRTVCRLREGIASREENIPAGLRLRIIPIGGRSPGKLIAVAVHHQSFVPRGRNLDAKSCPVDLAGLDLCFCSSRLLCVWRTNKSH